MQTINISSILKDLIPQYKYQIENKKLSFALCNQIPKKQNLINIDPQKYCAIIGYLLDNAIKFTNKGKIEVGCKIENKNLITFVKDTGIGIEKKYQEKVFDRFHQANLDNTLKYGGIGLGLSISKAYAELLEGKIRIDSIPLHGSIFYFSVPISYQKKNNYERTRKNI